MKVTIYTITDCQFSKQEKEYLTSHALPFEEKNLETNREFLTEMLTISNNFAGTPVTKIDKDDGQIVVLKGFTKEEFDKTLGFATTPPSETKPASENPPVQQQEQPQQAQVQQPATQSVVTLPDQQVNPQPVTNLTNSTNPTNSTDSTDSTNSTSSTNSTIADPLANVLNNLQEQAQTPVSQPVASVAPQNNDTPPSIPTPNL